MESELHAAISESYALLNEIAPHKENWDDSFFKIDPLMCVPDRHTPRATELLNSAFNSMTQQLELLRKVIYSLKLRKLKTKLSKIAPTFLKVRTGSRSSTARAHRRSRVGTKASSSSSGGSSDSDGPAPHPLQPIASPLSRVLFAPLASPLEVQQ